MLATLESMIHEIFQIIAIRFSESIPKSSGTCRAGYFFLWTFILTAYAGLILGSICRRIRFSTGPVARITEAQLSLLPTVMQSTIAGGTNARLPLFPPVTTIIATLRRSEERRVG